MCPVLDLGNPANTWAELERRAWKKCQSHLFYGRKRYLWSFSLTCYNIGHISFQWDGAELCFSFRKADNIFKTLSCLLFNRWLPLWFKICFISRLSFWVSSFVSWVCLLSPLHSHAVRYFLLASVFMCTGINSLISFNKLNRLKLVSMFLQFFAQLEEGRWVLGSWPFYSKLFPLTFLPQLCFGCSVVKMSKTCCFFFLKSWCCHTHVTVLTKEELWAALSCPGLWWCVGEGSTGDLNPAN